MFNNGLANLKKSGQYQKILDKYLKSDSKSNYFKYNSRWNNDLGLTSKQLQTIVKWFWVSLLPLPFSLSPLLWWSVLSSGCLVLALINGSAGQLKSLSMSFVGSHWWSLLPSSSGEFQTWLNRSQVINPQSTTLSQVPSPSPQCCCLYRRNCPWGDSSSSDWTDGSQPKPWNLLWQDHA